MKISKKAVAALCIIVPILVIVALFFLYITQKPDFSKYNSYAVVTDNGDIPLTDEQFRQIVNVYENDVLQYNWLSYDLVPLGWEIHLYETDDLSGNYVVMRTGTKAEEREWCIGVGDKEYSYSNGGNSNLVKEIMFKAIEQYESGQEV